MKSRCGCVPGFFRSLFVLATVAWLACGCAGVDSDALEVGTGVSNPPTLPSSFSPDYDNSIYESALIAEEADTVLLTSAGMQGFLTGPAADWTDDFLQGFIPKKRGYRESFRAFMTAVDKAVAADADFSLSSEPYLLRLDDERLLDPKNPWLVFVTLRDSGFVRVVILNRDDGKTWGYYLFLMDDTGWPVRGLFAAVDPQTLANGADAGVLFFGLAFDFSDPEVKKSIAVVDAFDDHSGNFVVSTLSQECETLSRECLGEFLSISTAPPTREFSSRSVRLSWDDDTHEICIAQTNYNDATTELGETQSFIGPDQPGDQDVTAGACQLSESDRLFTTADLPLRYADTSPSGGFAAELAGSGTTLTTWEAVLDEDTIENWLNGLF